MFQVQIQVNYAVYEKEFGRDLIDNDDRGDIWSRPQGGLVGQGNPGGPCFPDGLCCPDVTGSL